MRGKLRAVTHGSLAIAVALVVGLAGFQRPIAVRALGPLPHRASLPVIANQVEPPVPNMFGVEIFGTRAELTAVGALSAAGRLRVGFGRRNAVRWDLVEPRRGTYDLARTDEELLMVAAAGLHPIVIVQGTPQWARPAARYTLNGPFPEEYLQDYASVWRTLVARLSRFSSSGSEPRVGAGRMIWDGRWELSSS